MKTFLLAFLMLASVAFAANNPIDNLAEELSKNPLWRNGIYPTIDLPATAKHMEVIGEMFKLISFDEGKVKSFEINEVKEIKLQGQAYLAASCKTDLGRKIVLFRALDKGWWSRVYDEKDYLPQ